MIEKVNPAHPDKVADRIAGAIVDLAYKKEKNPKVAVEVLIGHGTCTIIGESSVEIGQVEAEEIVDRIAGSDIRDVELLWVEQDKHLSGNQADGFRCGDNGIFRGVPLDGEEREIAKIARAIYWKYPYDGKYILDRNKLIICQSKAPADDIRTLFPGATINPLGDWTGGTNVDTGATNRKLGSDMAQSVTGGGLHGKDLSKADVSVNIACFLRAQAAGNVVEACCAIGDDQILFSDGHKQVKIPYADVVEEAREFINKLGGFEKFAEWGLF